MANKNYTLDLSKLSSVDSALKADQEVAIKADGSTVVSVKTSNPVTNKVDLAGFGTIRTTDGKLVDFVADAGIAAGTYNVSLGSADTPVSINSFNAGNATNDLTVSIAADKFGSTGAKKVVTGSGKDTIYLDAGLVAFGGANADTFVADSQYASTISDYNYAQGDIVELNTVLASNAINWTNDGATITGGTTIKAAENDGAFKVLLKDSAGDKLLAAKAATGVAAEITLDSIAGKVDVSDAGSAVVDLGAGSDTVTGAANTALTLKVGLKDSINSSDALDDNDTIRFSSGSWDNVSVLSDDSGLSFGATKLNGVLGNNSNVFNVQFGDGEVQKVAYTSGTSGASVAAYNKDVKFYLGKSSTDAGINVNVDNEKVNLNLITGAKNVSKVTVAAAQELNLVAAGNSDISVSATSHKNDFVFDLTAKATATDDKLNITADNGTDIVKLSTVGGHDTVTGFKAANDVLVLTDVSTITNKTFVTNSNDLYLADTVKGAKVEGAVAAANAGKDITVQLSDGKVEKVAMVVDSNTITATEDTTVVIKDATATKLSLTSKAKGQMFDMSNVDANSSVKFVGDAFAEVTVGTEKGAAMFIGTKGVNNISVASGASENGAAVWAGKGNDATVTLSDGADIVWAGFLDGDVTVSGITKDDAVYTYGENLDAKAVAGKLSYDKKSDDLVFASSDTTKLNVGSAATGFKVAGNAGSIYNVVAGGATVEYSADADIFVGKDANLNVMVEKTAEIDLSGKMGFDSKIYSGIKNINASSSTSNSCLVLANSADGQINASAGGSAMWGGGNEHQNLVGGAGADIFWFGRADGADTATSVGKEDYVFLYNATDISEVEINADDNKLIFTNTGSTLTFANSVAVTEMTFSINDSANSGGFKNYSYDATSKTFVEKN